MTDITEIFARDPHNLSDQDLTQIIARYRDARKQFVQTAKPEKVAKKAKPSLLDNFGDIKL